MRILFRLFYFKNASYSRSKRLTNMQYNHKIDFRNYKNYKIIIDENSKLFTFVEFFTAINLERDIWL